MTYSIAQQQEEENLRVEGEQWRERDEAATKSYRTRSKRAATGSGTASRGSGLAGLIAYVIGFAIALPFVVAMRLAKFAVRLIIGTPAEAQGLVEPVASVQGASTSRPGLLNRLCATVVIMSSLTAGAVSLAMLHWHGSVPAALALTCVLVGLVIFLFNRQRSKSVTESNERDQARLQVLLDANARALHKGSEGEVAVDQAVQAILTEMGVPFWLPSHDGIKNAVLPPTTPGRISREIDVLVVCPFGVYVIEVKHWALKITAHDDPEKFQLERLSGDAEPSRDAPLRKTLSKVTELCRDVAPDVRRSALVVFSNPAGSFDARLPAQYVSIADLRLFFRQERDRAQTVVNPVEVGALLLDKLDRRPDAKHWHMMALPALNGDGSENTDIARYQQNDSAIKALQGKPPATYCPQFRARWWFAAGSVFLAGATGAHWDVLRADVATLTAWPAQQVAPRSATSPPAQPSKAAPKQPKRREK